MSITYEPDNSIRNGYISILGEISSDIVRNRWLTYMLFKRDLLAAYKQTFVGLLWAVIIPGVSVGMFTALNHSGIFVVGEIQAPYPLYALLSVMFWQLLSAGLIATSNSLVNAGSLIVKINCSKKSLVLASIGQPILSFFVQAVFAGILFAVYDKTPHPAAFALPLLMIPLLLFILGIGFIISILNGIFRDISNILSVILSFLMFLTPIFYAKPVHGILAQVSRFNPLFYLVSVPRDVILYGTSSAMDGYFLCTLLSVITFVVFLLVFHLTETRVAERI